MLCSPILAADGWQSLPQFCVRKKFTFLSDFGPRHTRRVGKKLLYHPNEVNFFLLSSSPTTAHQEHSIVQQGWPRLPEPRLKLCHPMKQDPGRLSASVSLLEGTITRVSPLTAEVCSICTYLLFPELHTFRCFLNNSPPICDTDVERLAIYTKFKITDVESSHE